MIKKLISLGLCLIMLISVFTVDIYALEKVTLPEDSAIYDSINSNAHPRLWIKKAELGSWQTRVSASDEMQAKLSSLISVCNDSKNIAPIAYSKSGLRAFGSCLNARNKLINMAVAYHLTGNDDYAAYAIDELNNVCGITDGSTWTDKTSGSLDVSWNVYDHYLDSGKLVVGIAFAYDMLYDKMTSDQREAIRSKIWQRYIAYADTIYDEGGFAHKTQMQISNWGAVCATAQLMISLAIMDDYAKDSDEANVLIKLIKNSLSTLDNLAVQFGSDGSWAEGVGYNEYMLEHMAWSAQSLANVFGSDLGLVSNSGVKYSPEFAMHIQTAQGSYNFASTTGTPDQFAPEAMLIANLIGDSEGYGRYRDYYKRYGEDSASYRARFLLFGSETPAEILYNNSLDKYWANTGLFTSCSDWQDEQSLYLGVNGGYTSEYYNTHYDKGSFVFNAIGERWIEDPGRNTTDADEYLKRTDMHSCLVINPDSEDIGQDRIEESRVAGGTMVKQQSADGESMIIYDLKTAYGDRVDSYNRGFFIGDNRRTLEIRDELRLSSASTLNMNFLTKADITVTDGGESAILTKNGKSVKVIADCSADGWNFTASKAVPEGGIPADADADYVADINKLSLVVLGASGDVSLSVKFIPCANELVYSPMHSEALSDWSVDENGKSIRIINPTDEWYTDTEKIITEYSSSPKSIEYYIDDRFIGESTDGEFELGNNVLPIGEHILKVRALYTDNSAAEDALNITVYKKEILQSASYDFNDFNGSNQNSLGFSISLKSCSTASAVTGRSGLPEDKALSLNYTNDDSLGSNLPFISFNNFTNYGSGMASFEFDIKSANPYIDYARISNMNLWHSDSFYLYSKNKADSTNALINEGWNHFKITENYASGTVTLELNGNVVYHGPQSSYISKDGTTEYFGNTYLQFELAQIGTRTEDTRAGFTIDNLKCEQYTVSDSYDVFTVSRPEIKKSGDKVIADLKISGIDNIKRDVCIILAGYSDGELKAISVNPHIIQAFNGNITAELDYNSSYSYKAFVIDNTDRLAPYMSATEGSI